MKVFLSWSGEISLKVATAFRDWLPSVIQSITPYVSAEDIDKGSRWSTDIAKELELSTYGILCITKANIDAPWINFEAGALSKTVEKSRVSPFLFNLKRSEVKGPLLQFQSTVHERDDIEKLVASINGSCVEAERLDAARLRRVFDVWWPELQRSLKAIPAGSPASSKSEDKSEITTSAILEELLDLARNQQKILRSPDLLLPVPYLAAAIRDVAGVTVRREETVARDAVEYLRKRYAPLRGLAEQARTDSSVVDDVCTRIAELSDVIEYLARWTSVPRMRHRHAERPTADETEP